jgi:hypothetical protein
VWLRVKPANHKIVPSRLGAALRHSLERLAIIYLSEQHG